MNNRIITLQDRKIVAMELAESLKAQPRNVVLVGNHGTGKKYVISNISEELQKTTGHSVLCFVGDQIVEVGEQYKPTKSEFSFSLSIYLGVSWNEVEKGNTKTNYILNCLRTIKSKSILIAIPDFQSCPSEVKDFINIICTNQTFFQEQLNKQISIIISSMHTIDEFRNLFETFEFSPYSVENIEEYVKSVLGYNKPIDDEKIKFERMQEICCSDLNLVNLLYRDLLQNSSSFSCSLSELVKQRLSALKTEGARKAISPEDLEEVILSCALSVEQFTRQEISEITERHEEIVNNSFYLSVENSLLAQITYDQFDFVSDEIKAILQQEMMRKHNSRLLSFYNYLTINRADEYLLRAYYLIRYERSVSEVSFTLLILATAKAALFNDCWTYEKILSILRDYGNQTMIHQYTLISQAYTKHCEKQYEESNKLISRCEMQNMTEVGKSEINRIKFKNFYLSNQDPTYEDKQSLVYLIKVVTEGLKLPRINGAVEVDESIQRLRIIYDIAPFILDRQNNYELFQTLYDKSREIMRQDGGRTKNAMTVKYITSIFNRKAFLFANPMQAMPYYEEAKVFFGKHRIWDEYCITLICQAGTCLACFEYEMACRLCEEALGICQEKSITLSHPKKLENNYELAKFLVFEDRCKDVYKIEKYALTLAAKFDNLAGEKPCGTKHVILTNAASLYLYGGDIENYLKIKKRIEKSLNCYDVSDISDQSVNDFYRYHFAWFELFYRMQVDDWQACENIFSMLNDFLPALFQKQENIWKMKNTAAQELIRWRKKVSGYEFSMKLVSCRFRERELSRFYHRGLMLSDLQYTSID